MRTYYVFILSSHLRTVLDHVWLLYAINAGQSPVCIDPRSLSVRQWTPLLRWLWTLPATGSASRNSRSLAAPRLPSGWSCSWDGASRPAPLPPSCVWTALRNSGARALAGLTATCGGGAADHSCPAFPSSTSVAFSSAVSWTCTPGGSTGTRSWSRVAYGGSEVLQGPRE